MLEGILVDLVPYGERFYKMEHGWYNGPGSFFWTMGSQWILSQAEVDDWRKHRADNPARAARRIAFGVQTKDGKPIGQFTIRNLDSYNRLADLSAIIGDPDYWSGGYGTDALTLLIDYAFDWLDVRRVWLTTMAANPRVMRQMEKVGFTLEVQQRELTVVNGTRADALIYGLLRAEWPGRDTVLERLKG